MKKFVFVLAVLLIAAPTWATSVWCDVGEGNDANLVTVYFSGASTAPVRGMAFDILLDGDGEISDVQCLSASYGYQIFPGSIDIDSSGNVSDWGSCKCDGGYAGTYDEPNAMTIEMGSLYADPEPAPNDAGELVSFRVVGTGTVHVGISVNEIRGGIVNEDTSVEASPTITDCNVQLVEPTCMASTHPDFATWQSLGEPDCWCYPRQCRGDIDGAQEYGVYWVLLNDLDIFKTYFQQTGIGAGSPGLCADLDHAIEYGVYRVLLNDLDVFKTYFQQTTVPCCDDNEDCDLTGDTQFNFWLP